MTSRSTRSASEVVRSESMVSKPSEAKTKSRDLKPLVSREASPANLKHMDPQVVTTANEMAEALGLPEALEPDTRNRWAKQLGAETMDAGKLMEIMRPEVEKILTLLGIITPPSMSMRAKDGIAALEVRINDMPDRKDVMCQETWWKQRRVLKNAQGLLEDFLAVHRTVWILEGKPGVH